MGWEGMERGAKGRVNGTLGAQRTNRTVYERKDVPVDTIVTSDNSSHYNSS